MLRIEKKATHVVETIAGRSRSLEIVRLSGLKETTNLADEMLAQLEQDDMHQLQILQLLEKAYLNNKIIHIADVIYHMQRNATILTQDPKNLIEQHKFILEYSEKSAELSQESNALFLEFVLNHAKTLTSEMRYAFFENLLSFAINAYGVEKIQPHPMQTIINHLYHYACGKREDQSVTKINLNETFSNLLIRQAQEKRQQGNLKWLSKSNGNMSKTKISEPTHTPSLRHSS